MTHHPEPILVHRDGPAQIWAFTEDHGKGPVWEFMVYGMTAGGDPRTAPSLGMACEIAGADPRAILAAFPDLRLT